MSLEQCTSLQGMAGDYLQTSSLDTRQLSLLSGMDTPAKYLENEQQTDGFQACECGKGTLDCSTHPSTPEAWTSFMRDSLAKILATPEVKQGLEKKRAVASTVKSSASLAWLDHERGFCWKTLQQSFMPDLEQSSQICWPRSGIAVNGFAYELPNVVPPMRETDGFSLATPTTVSNQLMPSMIKHKSCRNLVMAMLPTPTAHDRKKGAYPSEFKRNTPGIAVILGGTPSPMFQEWQMGWPINFTALKGLETGKFHCKQQQPTDSLEVAKC